MNDKIKVFISQPMGDKTNYEILKEREAAIKTIKKKYGKDVEIIESYAPLFCLEYNPDKGCIPLKYLSKSIEQLADAHIAYFCKGWDEYRGCRIEYLCAKSYDITIMKYNDNEI